MKKTLVSFLLLFVCLAVAAQTAADDSLRLDSIVRTLPEVMVSGERPVVKVRGGALVYDVNRLAGSTTAMAQLRIVFLDLGRSNMIF